MTNTFKELAKGVTLQSVTVERVISAGEFGITYYIRHNGWERNFTTKKFLHLDLLYTKFVLQKQ